MRHRKRNYSKRKRKYGPAVLNLRQAARKAIGHPPASQSEESVEEERILLSAPVPVPVTSTVPTKPVASAPAAFSISQLLSSDSNLGKEKKEKNSLENGSSEHKIPPALEPCAEITESPLIAAMGVVERIGCDSNTYNGEVTG